MLWRLPCADGQSVAGGGIEIFVDVPFIVAGVAGEDVDVIADRRGVAAVGDAGAGDGPDEILAIAPTVVVVLVQRAGDVDGGAVVVVVVPRAECAVGYGEAGCRYA